MSRRNALRRKRATVAPRRLFIVVCEGENTEPGYILELARNQKLAPVEIIIESAAGAPIDIARKAAQKSKKLPKNRKRKLSSFEKNDEVWAVFDRDNHPKISEAIDICNAVGVGVAYSNPCFEIWLILHFEDYDKPDGPKNVQKYCENICPGYTKKRKIAEYNKLLKYIDDAEKRAVAQQSRRLKEGDARGAPSTTVFQLTRAIRKTKI